MIGGVTATKAVTTKIPEVSGKNPRRNILGSALVDDSLHPLGSPQQIECAIRTFVVIHLLEEFSVLSRIGLSALMNVDSASNRSSSLSIKSCDLFGAALPPPSDLYTIRRAS